jgi:uncharacterized protein
LSAIESKGSWRERVVAYIEVEAQPADKFGHQPRLYALAAEIAKEADGECDDDVIFAAAWMHDLGVFLGHRPADPVELARWDHVPYTLARTEEKLREWGFPEAKLEAVAEAIRTHQPKDEPRTAEAVALRDADILEQLGAIGALRALVKVGRDTRYRLYSDVVPVLERAVRDLPGKLRTQRAKQLAEPRVAALQGLLVAIQAEAGDRLF